MLVETHHAKTLKETSSKLRSDWERFGGQPRHADATRMSSAAHQVLLWLGRRWFIILDSFGLPRSIRYETASGVSDDPFRLCNRRRRGGSTSGPGDLVIRPAGILRHLRPISLSLFPQGTRLRANEKPRRA